MSDLTAEEQKSVRAAIRFLRTRLGGADTLAKALRTSRLTVRKVLGGRPVSASIAMRVARLASVGVDDLLGGKYPPPGVCPHCGQPTKEAGE